MYKATGWYNGETETVWLATWADVLALVQVLEPDMYTAVLVVNADTELVVLSIAA